MTTQPMTVPALAARRALLQAQCLLEPFEAGSSSAALQRLIERLGFVQVDTINVIDRAHHLTLFSRMHKYRRAMLADLIEKRRTLWEHWTHDASVIPTQWAAHWKHRFDRYRQRVQRHAWWKARLGDEPEKLLASVRERVAKDGPLLSRDFEHQATNVPPAEKGWWGWKPQKAALEHLWRCGELVIVKRVNFQKVYDLTERAMPALHAAPLPPRDEHVEWACRSALERLGTATPGELAAFWHAIDLPAARAWCVSGLKSGELMEVMIESVDGSRPRKSVMFAKMERIMRRWLREQRASSPANDGPMRALSPFDPILRDRNRALRLFGFDYRFEAFVPAPQRRFGYYVMPLLQGERLVGRVNPKFHRDRGELVIDGLWWEKGVKPTRARQAALREALDRLAEFVGAERVRLSKRAGR
jgi:uncharacterized protein YcaQ